MNPYKSFIEVFNNNRYIKFKLYSLNYIIEYEKDLIVIYTTYDENRKKYYKSIEELLKEYKVFNEPLKDIINDIKLDK